jgi:hypothetical protein
MHISSFWRWLTFGLRRDRTPQLSSFRSSIVHAIKKSILCSAFRVPGSAFTLFHSSMCSLIGTRKENVSGGWPEKPNHRVRSSTRPELKTRGLALLLLCTKLQRSYFSIGAPFLFPVTPWIKGRPFGSPNPVTLSHPSSTVREVSAPNVIAKAEWSW